MYNQRILTEVLSHQPFDLRIPFLLILFTLTEFISASKSNTILCLIFSRLTYYKLRFWAGIGHLWVMYLAHGRKKKLSFEGTRMTMNSENKLQALYNIFSQGHIQTHWGLKPTAAPAEGLTPGSWFNQCPARGEAKQATKLPSSFPSSCHQCSPQVSPGEAIPRPPPGSFEDERNWVWGERWPRGGELDETLVVLFELLITVFKADLASCLLFCVWFIKICTLIKGSRWEFTRNHLSCSHTYMHTSFSSLKDKIITTNNNK